MTTTNPAPRGSGGKFAPRDTAAPPIGNDGKMVQATPSQVAEFGADMAAKDAEGEFRPARMDHGGRVQIIQHDGSVHDSLTHPACITRMEYLAEPLVTEGGFELPWRVSLRTLTGDRGPLPDGITATANLETYAALRRLPARGGLGETHEVTFFVSEVSMPDGRDPYDGLLPTLCPAFNRVTVTGPSDAFPEQTGWLWRCTALRFEGGFPSDWAGLHGHPELDDALLRPAALDPACQMVAVPLRRTASGGLYCAVAPRLPDPSRAGTQALAAEYAESALEFSSAVSLEAAAFAVSGAMDFIKAKLADSEGKLAAERTAHAAANRHHQEDVAVIGEELIDEASRRGWCDDYDTFVDSVNRRLHKALPAREREFDVQVDVSFTVLVKQRATSAEEACNEVDSEDVRFAIRACLPDLSSDDWKTDGATVSD